MNRLLAASVILVLGCTPATGGSTANSCVVPSDCAPAELCIEGRCQAMSAGVDAGGLAPLPGACRSAEICGNGLDDDCDGRADQDCPCESGATQRCYGGSPDVAGVGACRWGTQTCEEIAGAEFFSWGACLSEGSAGAEVCEGTLDEDCDGTIDEGCGCLIGERRDCYTGPEGSHREGTCRPGTQECLPVGDMGDWGPCEGEVTPVPDRCDGQDTDCDGVPNTGCECTLGEQRSCYSGPEGTAGVGLCAEGTERCAAGSDGIGASWGPCEGEVVPGEDLCDGTDHTCTGVPGAGCSCILGETRTCYGGPASTRGVGLCREGTNSCVMGAGSPEWSSGCVGQQTPSREVCDNGTDEDCDGQVDEGCGGSIACPPDQTVPAGQPVTLTATGDNIATYGWQIINGPDGGASSAAWNPSPANSESEQLTPFIVGEYEVQVVGTNPAGQMYPCTFQVTALPHGLRVELTWDGSGDLDLHLHNEDTSAPWFRAPGDCYYSNRSPAWGAALDVDNTSGFGPENIAIDSPQIGVDYTVAVHNYSRAAGRLATVSIFCGSTTSTLPTATYTSHPLNGTSSGNCSANDFWRVVRVNFTDASTCTLTPIETYEPSSDACMAY